MKIGQRILKILHPQDEKERMEYRFQAARALAEMEDLNRTIGVNGFDFKELASHMEIKIKQK